jgi:preprotein translocase subunit SecF
MNSSSTEKKPKPAANSSILSSSKEAPKIVEKAPIWATISGILLSLSILAITLSCLKYGTPLRLGLDFVGGTKIEYKFLNPIQKLTPGNIRDKALDPIDEKLGADSIAQVSGGKFLILRTPTLSVDQREKVDRSLKKAFGNYEILSVDTVSGTIGPELLRSGLIALVVTLIGILLFVSFRFRRDFAVCAIIALLHDLTIVLGLFAALGLVKGLEINILFLTACLTVLGFSIHDTIVVFDRIRENTKFLSKKRSLAQIVNESIGQVWFRSACTSFTVLLTLGALLLFGGETTRVFSGAMFAGIVTGTYSSIFVASVLLGQWSLLQEKKPAVSKKK